MKRQADIVKQMSPQELLYHLYVSQFVFASIGVILAYLLFDSFLQFQDIWGFNIFDIFVIGTAVGIMIVGADLSLMKYVPKDMFNDGGINEKMFQTRSVPHIIFLALLISTAEEFLFRGVIQTHFGIWIASVLFAVLHIRYLSKWLLFISVVLISFILGYLYETTNSLLVTIWAHFLIDVLLALKIRYDYVNRKSEMGAGVENDEE